MRNKISTFSEIAGAACITAGLGLRFGFDVSLIVGGIFAIVFSVLGASE